MYLQNLTTIKVIIYKENIYSWLKIHIVVVGCALVLLLQQTDLLPLPSQKITVIALLHELYRGEPIANSPFSAVFVHLMVKY